MSAKIERVLIANRGEIAVRILRACRELGLESVAIASDVDRTALHARLADRVELIGGATAAESYLQAGKILEAARRSGAHAIHPGYGFLAESASFAASVRDAGLIWVGPSPEVIAAMGIKTEARTRMQAAGVPVVPGAELPEKATAKQQQKIAASVGYPLLVKAAAGGGGKGMRAVDSSDQLQAAIAAARREAKSAFDDATVYLERQLIRPRHVEIQILADSHGKVLHLGQRDCSLQRRHQKVVEEAPAPRLPAATAAKMAEAAVTAARAVGYEGAGTVEMLLDATGEFFFLEMNTRLQVEHAVTEMIFGVDLVAEQLRVAAGEPLAWEQADLKARGHAMEARLYAEDPAQAFLPQTGEILLLELPSGPGLRVDSGVGNGDAVSLHYDPMLAKLVAYGPTRESARRRLVEALRATVLLGVGNNLSYLRAICEHPQFAAGNVHTSFLADHLGDFGGRAPGADEQIILGAATLLLRRPAPAAANSDPAGARRPLLWQELPGFALRPEAGS